MSTYTVDIPNLSSVTRGINYPAKYPLSATQNPNGYLYSGTKGSFICKANSDYTFDQSPIIFTWKQRPDGIVTGQEPLNVILKIITYTITGNQQIPYRTSALHEVSLTVSPTPTNSNFNILDSIQYYEFPNPTGYNDHVSMTWVTSLTHDPQTKTFQLALKTKTLGEKNLYKGLYYCY